MKETQTYALKQIELEDSPPDITVLNDNWDQIDNLLKQAENHKNDGSVHVSATDKNNWNSKAPGDHAHFTTSYNTDIADWLSTSLETGKMYWMRPDVNNVNNPFNSYGWLLILSNIRIGFGYVSNTHAPKICINEYINNAWNGWKELANHTGTVLRLAYTNTGTISNTNANKISLTNVTEIDQQELLTVSSNGITVNRTGYYLISGQIFYTTSSSANNHSATLAVYNGSNYILKAANRTSGASLDNCVTLPPALVYLNTGTNISLYYAGQSGDKIIGGTTSTTGTLYGTYLQLEYKGS